MIQCQTPEAFCVPGTDQVKKARNGFLVENTLGNRKECVLTVEGTASHLETRVV